MSSVNNDVVSVVFNCEWEIPQSIMVILDSSHYFMSLVKYNAFCFVEYDHASCLEEFGD